MTRADYECERKLNDRRHISAKFDQFLLCDKSVSRALTRNPFAAEDESDQNGQMIRLIRDLAGNYYVLYSNEKTSQFSLDIH